MARQPEACLSQGVPGALQSSRIETFAIVYPNPQDYKQCGVSTYMGGSSPSSGLKRDFIGQKAVLGSFMSTCAS